MDQIPCPRQRLPEGRVLPWHLLALPEATLPRPLQEPSIRL